MSPSVNKHSSIEEFTIEIYISAMRIIDFTSVLEYVEDSRGGSSVDALLEMLLICNCHLGKLLFEFDD